MMENIDFLISPAYRVPPMMTVLSSNEIITKASEFTPWISGSAWKFGA